MSNVPQFELSSCRRLFEQYPSSTSLRPAVDIIEQNIHVEPGLAFTHCRGLLETACVTILADRGIDIPAESKPKWLMSKTIQSLELTELPSDSKRAENGVGRILSGLNALVEGVVDIRNSQGVGPHGRDALERVLSAEYAAMTALAVDAAVGLLFRLHQEQIGRDPLNHLRFGVHPDFDAHIDEKYSEIIIEEVPISASQALYQQDRLAYRKSLSEFRSGENIDDSDIEEGTTLSEESNG